MLGVDDELAEDAWISTGQPPFELDRDYRYSAEWNTVSLQITVMRNCSSWIELELHVVTIGE